MNKIKEYFKDPMIVILCGLLVFITLGMGISGCVSGTGNKTVICIDAAYGETNKGYEGIVSETEVSGKVADELSKLLESNRKFQVVRTDRRQSVKERCAAINESYVDFVISIHGAVDLDGSVQGMKNIASVPANVNSAASLKMAESVSNAFKNDMNAIFTGYMYYKPDGDMFIKEYIDETDTSTYPYDTYDLLQDCNKPVVISEYCHVTSQKDTDTWCNEKGYEKAAQLYYQAILKYYE